MRFQCMFLTQRRTPLPRRAKNAAMDTPSATPPEPDPVPLSEGAARRAERMNTVRLRREMQTLVVMTRIHCDGRHGTEPRDEQGLCPACAGLVDYARKRLAACPFGPDKPTCVNCQIHCYGPKQREATREVMRYAGPRMLFKHPVLAIAHVLDGRRPAPPKPRGITPPKTPR